MQILERHHHRPVLGEALDQVAHDFERPELCGLGRELGELGIGVRTERQLQERAEVRGEFAGARAEQPVDRAAQRDRDAEVGIVGRHAQPGPEEVAERPVGHRLAVADAPALEPERTAVRGLRPSDQLAELLHHPGLADPGLPRQVEDGAGAAEHDPFHQGVGQRQLGFPADHRHPASAGRSRRGAGDTCHGIGLDG